MENEILVYTAGYMSVRLAVVLAFGYALFRVLRPAQIRADSTGDRFSAVRRAQLVPEDRC